MEIIIIKEVECLNEPQLRQDIMTRERNANCTQIEPSSGNDFRNLERDDGKGEKKDVPFICMWTIVAIK